jgi:hypothetical protein
MEQVLAFIKPISKNNDGTFEYDFFFTTTPEYVWGQDWDVNSPASNDNLTPDSTTYNEVKRVTTNLPLKTLGETTCYSMEYATYGVMALAWIDIENLDVYPEHGRLTMYFGETESEIKEKLLKYSWEFKN